MDDEQIEVVEHFKYLGSLKSADGNVPNWNGQEQYARPIWRDKGIHNDLKKKVLRPLLWTFLT